MGSQVPADFVCQFAKVTASELPTEADGTALGIRFTVVGASGVDLDKREVNTDDAFAEKDDQATVFGALGVLSRPLKPEATGGKQKHAEVICLRTADGLVPFAARDTRIKMGGAAPKEGTNALVGYAGAFVSLDMVDATDASKGNLLTIYVPYDFDSSGVAQKAHSIIVDPTGEGEPEGNPSISIIHAEGQAIFMQKGKTGQPPSIQMQSPNGQTFIKVEDSKMTIQAPQVCFNGSVYIGSPLLGVPLLPGVASPPCPRLFLAPTP